MARTTCKHLSFPTVVMPLTNSGRSGHQSPSPLERHVPCESLRAAPASFNLGVLAHLLTYQVRLTERAVMRDYGRTVLRGDVRRTTFSVMVLVESNPGVAQIDIVKELDIDKATIAGVVKTLIRQQYVVSAQSCEDRRRQRLSLTQYGYLRLTQLRQEVIRHEQRLTRNFSAQELAQLLKLLSRLDS